MGLSNKLTVISYGLPCWQRVFALLPGLYSIDSSILPPGYLVPAGTALGYWHNQKGLHRLEVIKQGIIYEAAGPEATVLKVKRFNPFIKNDCVAYLIAGKGVQITAIENTTLEYDTLELDDHLGVSIPEGGVIFQTATKTDDNAALMIDVIGLLHTESNTGAFNQVEVVVDGTLYGRRLICGLHDAIKESIKARISISDSK